MNIESILEKIEAQRKALGLSRTDLVLQTGMKYQTYASIFRRRKIPKFNDLYGICNCLGLPIDALIYDLDQDYEAPTDILYWVDRFNGGELDSTSILARVPDKEGVARMFMHLDAIPAENAQDRDAKTLIVRLMFMDEMDFLFLYINHIRPLFMASDHIDTGFRLSLREHSLLSDIYVHEYSRLFLRGDTARRPRPADAYLWEEIVRAVEEDGVDKKDMFAKTGISPALYSTYKQRSRKYGQAERIGNDRLSPYTETMASIFEHLGLSGMEDIIRADHTGGQEGCPDNEMPDAMTVVRKDLCSMPYLAQFLSALCTSGTHGGLGSILETVSGWGRPFHLYRYDPVLVRETDAYPSREAMMEGGRTHH